MVNYNELIVNDVMREKVLEYLNNHINLTLKRRSFDVPKRLFKYRSLNEYLIAALETNTFALTKPDLFNDFYDASIHRDSFERFYRNEVERRQLLEFFGYSDETPISENRLRKKAEQEDRFLLNYMKDAMKIGCLAGDNTSILMWSHYADENQGVCIEYDLTEASIRSYMYPVVYVPNPIDCSKLCDDGSPLFDIDLAMLLSAITKSTVWGYENEWRIILYHPNEERVHVNMSKPTAVYLGRFFLKKWMAEKQCNTPAYKALFKRFCAWIKDNNIDLYVMKNKVLAYEFYPEKIDIDMVIRLDEDELYERYLL